MPPLDCGIADYTAELADTLAGTREVDVYTDGTYMPKPRAAPNIHFRHVRDFDANEPGLKDSIFQLQARDYQAFMYPEIVAHGGTIMLHDMKVGAAIYSLARYLGRYSQFEDHMLAVEGPDAVRDLGVALARSGGILDPYQSDVFEKHPLLRWTISDTERLLTHTDWLAHRLSQYYPEAPTRVVRQGYGDKLPLVRHLPLSTWRVRLGLGPAGLIVGVFGIAGPNKRIEKAIAAFELLWKAHPDSLLMIVGRIYDAAYSDRVAQQIAASPAKTRIFMADYAPADIFHGLMALSDVLINLRWPTLGGMSATLMRGLAAGKPVIISDIPDWRTVESEACLPVSLDDDEVENIARHLLHLANDPDERRRLGRLAREWFAREATVQLMAADYISGGRAPAPSSPKVPHDQS